jgi:hypothetical protein
MRRAAITRIEQLIGRAPRRVLRASALVFIGLNVCGLLLLSIWRQTAPHALPRALRPAMPTATAIATTTPIPFARPELEAGVVFPRWGPSVYGPDDQGWASGLAALRQQTGARWVEMVIDLYQNGAQATTIGPGPGTPTPSAVAAGIATARQLGLQVFVVPFVTVLDAPDPWSGFIHFNDPAQTQAWFDGYWQALEPYAAVAAQAGAEQLAIGTEDVDLEAAAPALWEELIGRVASVYAGQLTYDLNWSSLPSAPQPWMLDPRLTYLGVSEYASLVSQPEDLSAEQILALWQQQIQPRLDALSLAARKPVILSEIGFRNATDALYQPWIHSTGASPDPQLQAAAYEAVTRAVFADPHLEGIFFYAWSNGQFAPNNLPAAAALRTLYLSPAA